MREISRRTAMHAIITSAISVMGCDIRGRYSENTPVAGANWAWKARAKASPSELTEMTKAVLAVTPDFVANTADSLKEAGVRSCLLSPR